MRPTTFLILTLILPFAPTINSSAIAASDDHASVSLQDEYDRYKSNNIEDKIRREEAALSTLSRSLTRSQCHANIAKTLKHSCQGAVDDVGNRLSEHNKRGLAISFTICSMQSALQKIPSECSQWNPFSSDGLNQNENYSLGSDLPEHNDLQEQQASCLSPQEWSAYNVYLSDTTQLCHALEARKQADLAHTRYVEANVEKVALLKLMKERESAQLARERNLSKDWENSSAALKRTSDLVFSAQQQLREDIDISSELRQDLRSTIKNLDLERAAVWGRIEKDVNDRLFEADVRFETILYSMRDGWAADLSSNINNVLQRYDLAVDDRIKEAEIATNTWIQNTTIQVADIFAYMTSQMSLMHSSWEDLDKWVDLTKQEMSALDQGFGRLHYTLASSIDTTQKISLAQAEIGKSLDMTLSQTENLVEKQDHLENVLNRSVDLAEKHLQLSTKWRPAASLSLFSASGALSFPSMGSINSQILFWLLQILWQTIYSTFSAICFLLILFRTGFRRTVMHWYSQTCDNSMDEESTIINQGVKTGPNLRSPFMKYDVRPIPPYTSTDPRYSASQFGGNQNNRAVYRSASAPL